MDSWNSPAVFQSSYAHVAARSAVIFWLGYIPAAFLIYVCVRNPKIYNLYKKSVVFAAAVMLWFSLPQTVFVTWFAFAVNEDLPTTVFICSVLKIATSSLTNASYCSIQAVSIFRYQTVARGRDMSTCAVFLIYSVLAAPNLGMFIFLLFAGTPIPLDVCSPVLFGTSLIPMMVFIIYAVAAPAIAVIFNFTTLHFLRKHRVVKTISSSLRSRRDDTHVAIGLLLQSFVPFFTITCINVLMSIGLSSSFSSGASRVLDIIGNFTVGASTLVSFVLIRAFQRAAMDMLRCQKTRLPDSIATASNHGTATAS